MLGLLTISLIPVSFPVGSLGLEEGRGGGTRAPAVSGVVGRFGTGTTPRNTWKFDWLGAVTQHGHRVQTNNNVYTVLHSRRCKTIMQQDLWLKNKQKKNIIATIMKSITGNNTEVKHIPK